MKQSQLVLKRTAAAVAVAGALVGNAQAVDYASFAAGFGPGNNAFLANFAGATAPTGGIEGLIKLVCATGASQTAAVASKYSATAGGGDGTPGQVLWVCNYIGDTNLSGAATSLAIGLPAGTPIGFRKQEGGSSEGVNPLVAPFPAVNFFNVSTSLSAAVAASCPFTANDGFFDVYTCNAASQTAGGGFLISSTVVDPVVATKNVYSAGFADTEPTIFNSGATAANNVTSSIGNQVVFGYAVSKNMYDALQAAQVTLPAAAGTDWNCTQNVAWTAGAPATDTRAVVEDCGQYAPSLSRSVLQAVFAGIATTWSSIAGLPPAPNNTVFLARRSNGSGTQKTHELNLFGGPSASPAACGASGGVSRTAFTDATLCASGTQPSFQGRSTDDVTACLTNHSAGGRWAVGILSTEVASKQTPVTQAGAAVVAPEGYRFIKVDGAIPNIVDAANGKYTHVWENSCNRNTTQFPPQANVGTFVSAACSNNGFNRAAIAALILPNFRSIVGQTGLLAVPRPGQATPAAPLTQAALIANPVSASRRAAGGTTANSCNEYRPISTSFNNPI